MEQKGEESIDTNLGVIGPLNFSKDDHVSVKDQLYPAVQVPCLFCDKTFIFYNEKHEYLAHLYLNHRLIIGDEEQVIIFGECLVKMVTNTIYFLYIGCNISRVFNSMASNFER